MSVLIKGMEMPTKENAVILITPSGDVWMIGNMPNEDTHLVKTKAVPVPSHDRLINSDAIEQGQTISGTYSASPSKMVKDDVTYKIDVPTEKWKFAKFVNPFTDEVYCPPNADRIRAMTDEELADWFIKIQNDVADYYDGGYAVAPELPTMKNSWLDWLKKKGSE